MAAGAAVDKARAPWQARCMERVTFHLPDGLRQSAEAGTHNFIARMVAVLRRAGAEVGFAGDGPLDRALALTRGGRAMFHMSEPARPGDLTFRRVYHYPFWQIERSAARWDWDVARAEFPGVENRAEAERFYRFWQTRLFGEAATEARRGDSLYVPLQGLIRQHRSFQSCAPLDMVAAVLAHAEGRPVIVGLHPNESYDATDMDALRRLCDGRAEIRTGGMEDALARCAMVVTQNSSAAFNGYLFGKPAVLFARIDFHHIAARVHDLGAEAALAKAETLRPDYAGYVWWFWQKMAINAGRPDAEAQIAARFRALGWPV